MSMMSKRLVLAALVFFGCSSGGAPSRPPVAGSGGSGAGGSAGSGETGGSGGTFGGLAGAAGGGAGTAGASAGASATPDAGSAAPDGGGGPLPPPGPPGTPLETVQVDGSGNAVMTETALAMGELYLLKATGSVDFGAQK